LLRIEFAFPISSPQATSWPGYY